MTVGGNHSYTLIIPYGAVRGMQKRDLEKALRDYHWMIKEIRRLRIMLADAGDRLTRAYGIESVMPKGKGEHGDPVYVEVTRREKRYSQLQEYETKARYVQQRLHLVKDERCQAVLSCVLDGLTIHEVAHHMGTSRRQVYNVLSQIVEQMQEKTPA